MAEVLGKDGALILVGVVAFIVTISMLWRWNRGRPALRERSAVEEVLFRFRVPLSILGGILWIGAVARGAFDADQGEGTGEGLLAAAVFATGVVLLCAYWAFRKPGRADGPARERVGRKVMTAGGLLLLLPFLWFQAVIAVLMCLGVGLRLNLPESVTGWRPQHLWFLVVGSGALLCRWAILPEKGAGWPGFTLVALFGLSWIAIGVTEKSFAKARAGTASEQRRSAAD